jgi:hypothetical protein
MTDLALFVRSSKGSLEGETEDGSESGNVDRVEERGNLAIQPSGTTIEE